MSDIIIFDFRKFSQYIIGSEAEQTQDKTATGEWYHHPARTQLAATFVHQIDMIHIFVYYSGKRLVRASINAQENEVKFVAQYPSIGFKQTDKGKLIKRFQMGFGNREEFDRCLNHIKLLGFHVKMISPKEAPSVDFETKDDLTDENLWMNSQVGALQVFSTNQRNVKQHQQTLVDRNQEPSKILQQLQVLPDGENGDTTLVNDNSYILSLSKKELCKLLSEKLKQKEFLTLLKKVDDAITNEFK